MFESSVTLGCVRVVSYGEYIPNRRMEHREPHGVYSRSPPIPLERNMNTVG